MFWNLAKPPLITADAGAGDANEGVATWALTGSASVHELRGKVIFVGLSMATLAEAHVQTDTDE